MASNGVSIEAKLDESGVLRGARKIKASLEDIESADKGLGWEGVEEGREQLGKTKSAADDLASSIEGAGGKLSAVGGAVAGALGLAAFADYAIESGDASARLAASLAGTEAAAEEFDGTLQNIYAAGYGDSFDDIAESANAVIQTMGSDIEPAALESITEKAITLRDTFGMDVPESVKAAQVMMQNFGMTSDEAFDMIAKGAQEGLNINGDMLDSFSEYSPYFKQLGLDADDMFNAFASGAEISMYGVDKAGDAFKEFGIRVVDGSDTTKAAFEAMGLDAEAYAQKIMEGGTAARQATSEIVSALLAIEDPVERNRQGVALFGTQWEDLGQDGAEAMLSLMGTAVDCEGTLAAIDDVRYDSIGGALRVIGRGIEVSVFQPIADKALPALSSVADWFASNPDAIANAVSSAASYAGIAIAGVGAAFVALNMGQIAATIGKVTAAFSALGKALMANPLGMIALAVTALVLAFKAAYDNIEPFRAAVDGLMAAIGEAFQPVLVALGEFFTGTLIPLLGQLAEFMGGLVTEAFTALAGFIVETVVPAVQQFGEFLAAYVVPALQQLSTFLTEVVAPALQAFWEWFSVNILPVLQEIAAFVATSVLSALQSLAGFIVETVVPAVQRLWQWFSANILPILADVASFLAANVVPAIRSLADFVTTKVIPALQGMWQWFSANILPILNTVAAIVIGTVVPALSSFAGFVTGTVVPAVQGLWEWFSANLLPILQDVWSSVQDGLAFFQEFASGIGEAIETARDVVGGAIDAIIGFFDFDITWPNIPMPQFVINPPGWQIGDLLKGSIPTLGINWYAKGGVFNGASIIGVGEAGPEAVLPLQGRYMQPFAQAVADNMDGSGDTKEIMQALKTIHKDLLAILDAVPEVWTEREFYRMLSRVAKDLA